MKNTAKKISANQEKEALEIIELAAADIETLAKAFNLIKDICEERDVSISLHDDIEDSLVH